MNKLKIEKPQSKQVIEVLRRVQINKLSHPAGEWSFGLDDPEYGQHYLEDLTFEEPIQPDSRLFRLIAAVQGKSMTLSELDGFDLDTLLKKWLVVGVMPKKGAGGRTVRIPALLFSLAEIKAFAATLEPTQPNLESPAAT